jgi:hypothetical protein
VTTKEKSFKKGTAVAPIRRIVGYKQKYINKEWKGFSPLRL